MANSGKRIKRVREAVEGRTQARFAKLIGVSRGAVGNWERGLGVRKENILLVAERTGVKAEWLMLMSGGDNDPIPFSHTATSQAALEIVSDDVISFSEAIKALAWTLQDMAEEPEERATALATAVLRAIRKPQSIGRSPPTDAQKRELVRLAIELFRTR